MGKLLVIFLMAINIISGQNKEIKGIIKDAETLEPVEFVNIYIENEIQNNSTGSISNEIGIFFLKSYSAKVTFSHINYESITLELNEGFNEIFLTPKEFALEEIVISTISPRNYLKGVIKNIEKKLDKNTLLKSYCREVVAVNNNITKFSDALVDYYIKRRNGKSSIILNQHRALSNKGIDDLDIQSINSIFKLKDYVKDAYNFEELNKVIKDKNYTFERKFKKETNGLEYEYVTIIPNVESDELLSKGYVIIDQKTGYILEYKLYTSEEHLKNAKLVNMLIAKAELNNYLSWSKFRILNKKYILTYNKKELDFFIKIGKTVNDDFKFSSDLFVYEFLDNVEMPQKGSRNKTIYEAGTNYNEEFWAKYNSFPLTKEELDFINIAIEK